MLKNISPLLSPELLALLCRMGHGDQIVIADAHFPAETCAQRLVRADGLKIVPLLEGILPLLALDTYIDAPVVMMAPVEGDTPDPAVETAYRRVIDRHCPETPPIGKVERFAFYEAAKSSFAILATGDTSKYGNIILTKGVTPSP